MRPGTLMPVLLLGLGLSAGPASAVEIGAPTERPDAGANMVRPAPAGTAGQPRSGAKKVRANKVRANKGRGDTESALKKGSAVAGRGSGTGEAIPDDTAPAPEPQSVALRGVRG